MNTIQILHREARDTTQMRTPNLDFYHESMMPAFKDSYYRTSTGKEAFRLIGNTVHFHGNTTDQDVRAAMELLQKKGVDEVMPQGTDDFLISVHQAGYHKRIEVVHTDIIDSDNLTVVKTEPAKAIYIDNSKNRTKGPRPR